MITALVVSALLSAATASGPGWARATSQLKEGQPALFQPLNVLDGKETTAWCEGVDGEGVGELLVLGFKEKTAIDEVRLVTGDGRDARAFQAHNRIRNVTLREATTIHHLTLNDARGPQSFKLDPPLHTDRVELEIAEVLKGTGKDDATCLSDIVFLSRGRPLNGAFLADKLRYDRGHAQLMNRWYAGPKGAPERFLSFYFDGTFHYAYRPFDPEVPKADIVGEYEFRAGRLAIKPKGKSWTQARAKRTVTEGDDGVTRANLQIVSEELEGSLAGEWTDDREGK